MPKNLNIKPIARKTSAIKKPKNTGQEKIIEEVSKRNTNKTLFPKTILIPRRVRYILLRTRHLMGAEKVRVLDSYIRNLKFSQQELSRVELDSLIRLITGSEFLKRKPDLEVLAYVSQRLAPGTYNEKELAEFRRKINKNLS